MPCTLWIVSPLLWSMWRTHTFSMVTLNYCSTIQDSVKCWCPPETVSDISYARTLWIITILRKCATHLLLTHWIVSLLPWTVYHKWFLIYLSGQCITVTTNVLLNVSKYIPCIYDFDCVLSSTTFNCLPITFDNMPHNGAKFCRLYCTTTVVCDNSNRVQLMELCSLGYLRVCCTALNPHIA